ncbi:glycosyltransferase [Thalassotalea agarivorans]|uniref:Glycosyltransferase involved in cell wall bisynthesis n=1 Tax=Thalassotalea agarivorans TaxID=349064 RepID=A0A1I0HT15_THASX|nr:glycosyltransferase [Thalassotalea agarivorans]SET87347.1 Glycosyltransferase involved in cell wall bisynthesis [Thalassotalea agarivorans]
MQKHIVCVIDSLSGGGAEKMAIVLAQSLQALGHKVTFLSLVKKHDYDLPVDIDVEFLYIDNRRKIDAFWRKRYSIKLLERWFDGLPIPADLVLSHLDKANNLLTQSKINNVFYVVHNSIKGELERQTKLGFFSYRYLKSSKQRLSGENLVAVSDGIKSEIESLDWLVPKSITRIYNPFNFQEIKRFAQEKQMGIPKHPYIIHVGRVAKQKRHDVLFSALAKMKQKISVVVLCSNIKKVRTIARKYQVDDQVITPGFVQNPYAWIKHAECLVLTSDYEGFGNVLVEALALSVAVVSTNCPHGPSEILTGKLSRCLWPVGDSGALANQLDGILEHKEGVIPKPEILDKVGALDIAKQYLKLIKD